LVKVGWFKEMPRANLVEVALEKQDAKKRFRRLAFPREDDSDWESRWRSMGMRLVLGESL